MLAVLYLVRSHQLIDFDNFEFIDVILRPVLVPPAARALTGGFIEVISLEIQILVMQVFNIRVVRRNHTVLLRLNHVDLQAWFL